MSKCKKCGYCEHCGRSDEDTKPEPVSPWTSTNDHPCPACGLRGLHSCPKRTYGVWDIYGVKGPVSVFGEDCYK